MTRRAPGHGSLHRGPRDRFDPELVHAAEVVAPEPLVERLDAYALGKEPGWATEV
jgi:hypothetical protein